jgi:hypothetical protein
MIVTVPANVEDNSTKNLIINYKLNDTVSIYSHDLDVQFMAPDYCKTA